MIQKRYILPILIGMLVLSPAGALRAQSLGGTNPVQYIVAPETPGPNQRVNIEINGVGAFLGSATITWQQNGETVYSGIGANNFSFVTGDIGTMTRIRVTIVSSTQGTIARDFTFYPSIVNLVWEADTSTPRLFLGKPLYSAGSRLRVVAFPLVMSGGSLVSANKLSYQWQRNGSPEAPQSGLGAHVLVFNGDQLKIGEEVSVDVYLGTNKIGRGSISVPATDPSVIFYYKDPLRGEILDRALTDSVTLGGKEVTVQAEPYFFSRSSKEKGTIQYSWTLNNQEVTGAQAAQGILTLRQTGEGTGSATLGVSLQNTDRDKFVQAATTAFQVAFGQSSGSFISSFFGL